jgi:Domain of unknown function (DUF4268)
MSEDHMSDAIGIPNLGRLRSVELREVWASEPYSFTPWLAQTDNLQFLAESLGLPGLELVATERQVDIFSADIVAKASGTGETVLIENQIERSDHVHLGQILTYAAGLEAAIIVWVSKRFTEGHRAAIDWLNRITAKDFAFFAVEVEAFRIGESVPAPRFTVVSRPNDWARSLRAVSHDPAIDKQANAHASYWNGYDAAAAAIGAPVRKAAQQVRTTNYYVAAGMRGVYFSAWRSSTTKNVGVYLAMFGDEADRIFKYLASRREELEQALGEPLEWSVRKEGTVYWIVAGKLPAASEESDWPRQHAWLAQMMKRLAAAFAPALEAMSSAETEDPPPTELGTVQPL